MEKKGIEMSLWHVSNPPLMLVQQETTKLQCALSQGCRLHATRYYTYTYFKIDVKVQETKELGLSDEKD